MYREDNIEVIGGNIEDFICDDFKVMRKRRVISTVTENGRDVKATIRRWGSSFIRKKVCQRPVIDKMKCTVCGTCVKY